MKLTKCVNGHFYDEEKFESCPHCAGGSKLDVNEIFGGTPAAPKPAMAKVEQDDDMTVPLDWVPANEPVMATIPEEKAEETEKKAEELEKPVQEPEEPEFELLSKFGSSAEPEVHTPEPAWEMSQPNVEEITTGDHPVAAVPIDPELEDQPTEIVDEAEVELVNGLLSEEEMENPAAAEIPASAQQVSEPKAPANIPAEPSVASDPGVTAKPSVAPDPSVTAKPSVAPDPGVTAKPGVAPDPSVTPEPIVASDTVKTPEPMAAIPSPAPAMFGASDAEEDDEHTVAFYDDVFTAVSRTATEAPVQEHGKTEAAASVAAETADARAAEPNVFTAPPLPKVQTLPTPCVGWLIALNGVHIGQDFHLRVGKNYIGRDESMDIALVGDKSVSRNKHAIVIYEPKHHRYFIQPGESNELVYVNDEVVLLPMELKPYDLIVIGDVELWFMPLCDAQHNWSEVIHKLQEQMQQ